MTTEEDWETYQEMQKEDGVDLDEDELYSVDERDYFVLMDKKKNKKHKVNKKKKSRVA